MEERRLPRESFPTSSPSGGLPTPSNTCVPGSSLTRSGFSQQPSVSGKWELTQYDIVVTSLPFISTSSQIDAVGGEHNLIIPSSNEQIRGVDFIVRHPNYTHGDASVGGMAVRLSNSFLYYLSDLFKFLKGGICTFCVYCKPNFFLLPQLDGGLLFGGS